MAGAGVGLTAEKRLEQGSKQNHTTPMGQTVQAAERHLSRGCVGAFQSPEWALVKWLTGTDEVVDQALNDQQRRK